MKHFKNIFFSILLIVLTACVKKVEDYDNVASVENISQESTANDKETGKMNPVSGENNSMPTKEFNSKIDAYNNRVNEINKNKDELYVAIEIKKDLAEVTIAGIENNETWLKKSTWVENYNVYESEQELIKEVIKKINNKGNIAYSNYTFFKNSELMNCEMCDKITNLLSTKDVYKDNFILKKYSQSDLDKFLFKSLITKEFRNNTFGFSMQEKNSKILYLNKDVLRVISTIGTETVDSKKVILDNIKSKLNGMNVNYANCFVSGLKSNSKDIKTKLYRVQENNLSMSENEELIISAVKQSGSKPSIYNNENASYAIEVILNNIKN